MTLFDDPSRFDALFIAATPLAVLFLAALVFVYALWSETRRESARPLRDPDGFGGQNRPARALRHDWLRRRERLVPRRASPPRDPDLSSRKETA